MMVAALGDGVGRTRREGGGGSVKRSPGSGRTSERQVRQPDAGQLQRHRASPHAKEQLRTVFKCENYNAQKIRKCEKSQRRENSREQESAHNRVGGPPDGYGGVCRNVSLRIIFLSPQRTSSPAKFRENVLGTGALSLAREGARLSDGQLQTAHQWEVRVEEAVVQDVCGSSLVCSGRG
jgi:hypothetical protein